MLSGACGAFSRARLSAHAHWRALVPVPVCRRHGARRHGSSVGSAVQLTGRMWLFALALGLLAQHEERLLACGDVPTLFTAVRAIGKSTPSYTELRDLTKGFPSEADVQVARAAYLRAYPPPHADPGEAEADAEQTVSDAPPPPPHASAPAAEVASMLPPEPNGEVDRSSSSSSSSSSGPPAAAAAAEG